MSETDERGVAGLAVEDIQLEHVRSLVREAFRAAARSGKGDGITMKTAVLKNRLLDLTERQFDERLYGARSFVQLLRAIPDLVRIEGDRSPYTVRLLDSEINLESPSDVEREVEDATSTVVLSPTRRIRPDLWRAVLDYSSGLAYNWDVESDQVLVGRLDDVTAAPFPTATPDDIANWREEFIRSTVESEPELREELAEWTQRGGSTRYLPSRLRPKWNEELKRHVIGYLTAAFAERDWQLPDDALAEVARSSTTSKASQRDPLSELRALVIRCVYVMNYDELRDLRVPVHVLQRLSQ